MDVNDGNVADGWHACRYWKSLSVAKFIFISPQFLSALLAVEKEQRGRNDNVENAWNMASILCWMTEKLSVRVEHVFILWQIIFFSCSRSFSPYTASICIFYQSFICNDDEEHVSILFPIFSVSLHLMLYMMHRIMNSTRWWWFYNIIRLCDCKLQVKWCSHSLPSLHIHIVVVLFSDLFAVEQQQLRRIL